MARCLVLLLLYGGSLAAQKPLTLVQILSLDTPANPVLSPDGAQVLFEISTADWKANRRVSHIWRLPAAGGPMVRMTNGSGETQPVWSPDGTRFAFLRRVEGRNQIFLLPTAGGEAEQWTRHETAVSQPAWSPDGSRLYFVAPDKTPDRGRDDEYVFERNQPYRRLWDIGAGPDRRERRLTDGPLDVREFSVAPDGRSLLFVGAPTPLLNDSRSGEIYRLDLASGGRQRLTSNGVAESDPRLSPDGSQILFLAPSDPELADGYHQRGVFVMPASGGPPRLQAPDFQGEVIAAEWAGPGMLLLANLGLENHVFRLRPGARLPEPLTSGPRVISQFRYCPGPNRWVAISSDPASAGDVWLQERRLTTLNPLLQSAPLARVEPYRWKGKDGAALDGVLVYPIDYQPGRRYPLVAQIHGGPQGASKRNFAVYGTTYPQYWAGRGYLLFHPNHRGSSGYGNAFLRDLQGFYWRNAADDVLTGIDALVRDGLADPDRLGIMGWSAGGHMTNWLITRTDRFKAASSGAGAANWISMYSQSDIRAHRDFWFGGDPWGEGAPLDVYLKSSPAFFAQRVKTPTLIMVGERDERVPMQQSVEMYRALKRNGATVELVIFPREGHGFEELRHRLAKAVREFGWFEKHLRGIDYVPEKAPDESK
jgi:dipeptidyl aminopeptidase/acylaminoacyl peptidase